MSTGYYPVGYRPKPDIRLIQTPDIRYLVTTGYLDQANKESYHIPVFSRYLASKCVSGTTPNTTVNTSTLTLNVFRRRRWRAHPVCVCGKDGWGEDSQSLFLPKPELCAKDNGECTVWYQRLPSAICNRKTSIELVNRKLSEDSFI